MKEYNSEWEHTTQNQSIQPGRPDLGLESPGEIFYLNSEESGGAGGSVPGRGSSVGSSSEGECCHI